MGNPFSLSSRYRDFSHETGFTEISIRQVLRLAGFADISVASSGIHGKTFRSRVRSVMVAILWKWMKFLYYIQDFTVPENMGKNLIAVAKKT